MRIYRRLAIPTFLSFVAVMVVLLNSLTVSAATVSTYNPNHNWAGYHVSLSQSTNPTLVSVVDMDWKVPAVNCTKGGKPISGKIGIWTGLGGVGELLAQLGTANECTNGDNTSWAWWEVQPTIDPQRLPETVSPGDDIDASVSYNRDGSYKLMLTNYTQHWDFDKSWKNPTTRPHTAECIVEKVTHAILPQFATINVNVCHWAQFKPYANTAPWYPFSKGANLTRDEVAESYLGIIFPKTETSALSSDGTSFSVNWKGY
jgi:Peptidase A4 family